MFSFLLFFIVTEKRKHGHWICIQAFYSDSFWYEDMYRPFTLHTSSDHLQKLIKRDVTYCDTVCVCKRMCEILMICIYKSSIDFRGNEWTLENWFRITLNYWTFITAEIYTRLCKNSDTTWWFSVFLYLRLFLCWSQM